MAAGVLKYPTLVVNLKNKKTQAVFIWCCYHIVIVKGWMTVLI